MLIAHGANPYFREKEGETSIMAAADIHDESFKYIQLCLNSKYTQRLPDSLRRIYLSEALIVAAGKFLEELDGVRVLVDAGADINYISNDSTLTPINQSIIRRNLTITKYLIVEKKGLFSKLCQVKKRT